jgi:PleD family two-component response regulator
MFTNNETVVQLINEADQAMYQAKKEGKAYKFFDK